MLVLINCNKMFVMMLTDPSNMDVVVSIYKVMSFWCLKATHFTEND